MDFIQEIIITFIEIFVWYCTIIASVEIVKAISDDYSFFSKKNKIISNTLENTYEQDLSQTKKAIETVVYTISGLDIQIEVFNEKYLGVVNEDMLNEDVNELRTKLYQAKKNLFFINNN